LLVVAVLVTLMVGAAGMLVLRPLALPLSAPVSTAAPTPSTVMLTLTSDPNAAAVYRAGDSQPLGLTPLVVTVPAGRSALDFTIAKDGFVPAHLRVIPDDSRPFLVWLAPLAPASPEPPARRPRASRRNAGKIRNAVPVDPFVR
jgi:hypothetical protein